MPPPTIMMWNSSLGFGDAMVVRELDRGLQGRLSKYHKACM